MAFRTRKIATRFALILAAASVVPLVAYGVLSIVSLRNSTRESVVSGNLNVAARAAEEIHRYVRGNARILQALASDLTDTSLEPWQQERIVKNYVLQFPEFREITLFDQDRRTLATSRVGPPRVEPRAEVSARFDNVTMSSIRVDEDLLPTSVFAVTVTRLNAPAGYLVGEISLEDMWRMVDLVRIGEHGFALVVAPDGTLIAHGNPDKKALVAQATPMSNHPLVVKNDDDAPAFREYTDLEGDQQLAVAAPIAPLGWTVIVEQPTAEAYAGAIALQRQLTAVITIALLVTAAIGLLAGRKFIAPIFKLQRATQDIARGNLAARVAIDTGDEFTELGNAFNAMADRLVALQEDVKRQERQALFGRIAAGLIHDLAHPIQNIGNSARLLLRDDLDAESRDMFRRTIERELATLRRFMDDLRNLVKPKPIEPFEMEINGSLSEVLESMRTDAERSGVVLEARYSSAPLLIEGDRFALGRVYRNLVTNAIQATESGGRVVVSTARTGDQVQITITDTGSGIAPDRLSAIFDDFVTTKRRGLGLGLAISKRIVEQLGGSIHVESVVGQGTSFTLRFPARGDAPAHAAAS